MVSGAKSPPIIGYSIDFVMRRRFTAPRRGERFPSRAGASGSYHLPWALLLLRVLHARAKSNRRVGGSAGHGHDTVCSKGASSALLPGKRASGIAARTAGRGHGSGRGGRRSNDTGKRRRATRNGRGRASATGSGSKAENPQSQKQLRRPRG